MHILRTVTFVVLICGLQSGDSLVTPNLPDLIYNSAIFRQKNRQSIISRFSKSKMICSMALSKEQC